MKPNYSAQKKLFALAAFALAAGGVSLAQPAAKPDIQVKQISQRNIAEKLHGKEASATVLEVTFGQGQKDTHHRHAGPVFGYVLEGEYLHGINDDPVNSYKAGDTFYEPSGAVHSVAANPSQTNKTRLLVVILHPRDVKEVTVWEHGNH